MWASNATVIAASPERPDAAALCSSSSLIQRRAAPIPRDGEDASLAVWRVPKAASFSTCPFAEAAVISRIAATTSASAVPPRVDGARGAAAGSAEGALVLVGPALAVQPAAA